MKKNIAIIALLVTIVSGLIYRQYAADLTRTYMYQGGAMSVASSGTNAPIQLAVTTNTYPADASITNGDLAGSIWYGGTTSNSHTLFFNAWKVARSVVLAQNIVLADTTVSNNATGGATNLYVLPLGADYLTIGKTFETRLSGLVWQNANNNSFPTIPAWINETNLLVSVPLLVNTAITAGPSELTFTFTCRSIGSGTSASMVAKCQEIQAATSGGVATVNIDVTLAPVTFDSTIWNTITITTSNRVAGGGGFCSYRLIGGRTLCVDSIPKLPGEL